MSDQSLHEYPYLESEEQYLKLFALSGVAKAEYNLHSGLFTRVNSRFCRLTGYGEHELLQLSSLDLTHPDDREREKMAEKCVLQGEQSSWNGEKRYIKKDGTQIWVEVSGTLLNDNNGNPSRAITEVTDCTLRKHVGEKHLSNSTGTSGAKVEQQLLENVTSRVVHEVRNPLNALSAITDALFNRLGEHESYSQYVTHIRNQIRRLSHLMEKLHAFGKSFGVNNCVQIRVDTLVHDAVGDWCGSTSERQKLIQVEIPEEYRSLLLSVDKIKMLRVFINILENAVQHLPEDGKIKITVDTPEKTQLRIRFIDNGSGVKSETLSSLYEPFISTGTSETGLGLSIVKNTVENHGGMQRIFNNESSSGVTVEIVLPVIVETP